MRFVYFLILLLASCNVDKKILTLEKSEDSLTLDVNFFNGYHRFKTISDTIFLQSFEPLTSEISLSEVRSGRKVLTIYPLLNFKNDSIGRLIQFDIYKRDSIFIVTENSVYIINSAGQVIYSKSLVGIKTDNDREILFWDNHNQFPLFYDGEKKELLLKAISNCYFMDTEFFEGSIEAKLNLVSGEIRFFDYGYPQSHKKKSFGQAVFPFREIVNDNSIVSSPIFRTTQN